MRNIALLASLGSLSLLSSVCFAAEGASSGAAAPADSKVEEKVVLKRNGIKRPDSDSITGKLWDIADRISAELGCPAPRKAVVDAYMAEVVGANAATAQTQYARWVVYHDAADALAERRKLEVEERRKAKESELSAADKKKAEEKAAAIKAKEEEKATKAAEREATKKAKDAEKAKAKEAKEAEKKAKQQEKERIAKEAADKKAADAAAKAQESQPAA